MKAKRNMAHVKNSLTFDGDSMLDYPAAHGSRDTIPVMVQQKMHGQWNLYDFSQNGDTVAGAIGGLWQVNGTYKAAAQRNELVVWLGTNDGALESDDAAEAAAEMQQYLAMELAVGWRITFLACLQRGPASGGPWNPDEATFRVDYNNLMRAWCSPNGVRFLDPAQDPRLADPFNTAYYGDALHLTPAGKLIVADQIVQLIK